MKKITLLLIMLLSIAGAKAEDVSRSVAFLGNYVFTEAWGGGGAQLNLPATAFTGVAADSYLIVKGTGTIEMHENGAWGHQIDVDMSEEGKLIILTAAQAGYVANGLQIQSKTAGAVLKEISFGESLVAETEFLSTAVNTFSWTADQTEDWKVGDEIKFTFEAINSSEAFQFDFCQTDVDGWPSIDGVNWLWYGAGSGPQEKTITVTDKMAKHALQARGNNIKFTSIVHYAKQTPVYTYLFVDGVSNINVEKLSETGNFRLAGRNFDNYWNTLCLPFDCPFSAFAGNSNFKVYRFKEYSPENGLVFTERTPSNLSAGVPYLVNFEGTAATGITADNVSFNTTITPDAVGGFTFTGNYDDDLDMEGKYGIAWSSVDNQTKFRKGGSGSTLDAFRSYFSTVGDISAHEMTVTFEDEVTGISRVATAEEAQAIYNLMGVRQAKLQKGLNIVDGKKVLVK